MTLTSADMEVTAHLQNAEKNRKACQKKNYYHSYANVYAIDEDPQEEISQSKAINGPDKKQWQNANQ